MYQKTPLWRKDISENPTLEESVLKPLLLSMNVKYAMCIETILTKELDSGGAVAPGAVQFFGQLNP